MYSAGESEIKSPTANWTLKQRRAKLLQELFARDERRVQELELVRQQLADLPRRGGPRGRQGPWGWRTGRSRG